MEEYQPPAESEPQALPSEEGPVRDEAYWEEIRAAVGNGTRSILFGTSTRSLERSLAKLRGIVEGQDPTDSTPDKSVG